MFISRTMSLGARVFLLLVPLVTALDSTARAVESGDFAGLVDIGGGRKMYLECRGTGSPTVVLLAGLKGSAEDWSIVEKTAPTVFSEVAKFTRVCAYDRPGTPVEEKPSRSDPVPQPTTAEDAVADLHALLSAAGEAGPLRACRALLWRSGRQALCELQKPAAGRVYGVPRLSR
jgi:pimeloyl-ACP methyl ester carboxylesterase